MSLRILLAVCVALIPISALAQATEGNARRATVISGVAVGAEVLFQRGDQQSVSDARSDRGHGLKLDARWRVDNRAQLGAVDGLLHLAAGVTSIRVTTGDQRTFTQRVTRLERVEALGPRVFSAGLMEGAAASAAGDNRIPDSAVDIEKRVLAYAQKGFGQIHIASSVRREWVPLIARIAHARGLRVSSEVVAQANAENTIGAGADALQQASIKPLMMADGDLSIPVSGTRFEPKFEEPKSLSVPDPCERALIQMLAARGVVVTSSINMLECRFQAARGQIEPGYLAVVARLPPQIRRALQQGRDLPVADTATNAKLVAASFSFLRSMRAAGVLLTLGSGGMPGFSPLRELELYAAAGILNADILRTATVGSAQANRRDHALGSIKPGSLADLVLLDGDPLARIADIRRARWVMKGGVRFDVKALYAELGVGFNP